MNPILNFGIHCLILLFRSQILYVLTLSAVIASEAPTLAIPERPIYPVKMDVLSDAEFGRLFFPEIDLGFPGMEPVREALGRNDYTAAFAGWSKVFVQRMQSLPLVSWPTHNWYPLDLPMTADRVILKQGNFPKDFGPVGQMDWWNLKHWEQDSNTSLHVNCMWHTKVLIFKVEHNQGKTEQTYHESLHLSRDAALRSAIAQASFTNEQLFTRWSGIWRDFVNNNWRLGLPLASDPELRRATLAAAGLETEPSEWGTMLAFKQQVVVSWLIGNWFADTQHAIQAAPEEFTTYVSPRTLAEMVYFMVVWPIENLTNMRQMPLEQLAGGAPNQSQEKSVQLLRFATLAPEFHRGQRLNDLSGKLIKTILGVDGFFANTTDQQADGSGTELSYNYMTSLIDSAENWLRTAEKMQPMPDWVEPARQALEMRSRFYAHLSTPTGMRPLCKGPHGAQGPVPFVGRDGTRPAYTSMAFPYHGLYIMRSGWRPHDLYLSLVNCRAGLGHAAEDSNSIILEAYGRYMLVHSAGEGWGNSPYFGSSWAKNTVHVDGLAQRRCAQPPHGAFKEPLDGRWHTSDRFDFAEATYRYGYGPAPLNMKDIPRVEISDVTHTRQAIFVKEAALWFVVDIINAPEGATHEYEQLWHFHKDFGRETVLPDSTTQTIAARDAGCANLFVYQSAPQSMTYRKYYGEGWSGTGDMHTGNMPTSVRGWHNTGGGYDGRDIHPAVDVHAVWRGSGRQLVVTALVPAENTVSPVVNSERIDSTDRSGLVIQLNSGLKITFIAAKAAEAISLPLFFAPGHALVMVERAGTPVSGLFLGPDPENRNTKNSSSHYNFEFVIEEGKPKALAQIKAPSGFRWQQEASGIRPVYQ